MSRTFKTVDYAVTLELEVRLGDCLPPEHLACFVADSRGAGSVRHLCPLRRQRGQPYDPALLLGLLFYPDGGGGGHPG